LADQNHVLVAAHEVARGQRLDDPSVHTLSVELPIKAFQSRQFVEPRRSNPPLDGTLSFGFGWTGKQAMQELQMAQ